jgi:acyl-coenzyme A thioesterase 13
MQTGVVEILSALICLTILLVHGGLILSLTDTIGSLAIASKGYFMTGVSTDIGTSFVRPAGRVGDVVYAKGVVTAMGNVQTSFWEV